jgi:tubby-related protein 1
MSDENFIFMQFGKTGKNSFNMDVQWPISLFQAFGIALTSIDKKYGCE